MGNLIENRTDGTTVVYIAFWRYCFIGLLFAGAFYVLLWTIVNLYHERPADFWQHWNQTAGLISGAFIGAIAILLFAYWMLNGFYKKVQLEIGRSSLRYLRGGVRGGVLLSDDYEHINYAAITDIKMDQQILVNGVILVQTGPKIHKIILLLTESEKLQCLAAIQAAVEAARKRRP